MIDRFHLRSASFPEWTLLQIFPSMYNFENELWVSSKPLTPEMLRGKEILPEGTTHRWVNHFPLHDISFDPRYRKFFYQRKLSYVYVRSRIGREEKISEYAVQADAQGIRLIDLDGEKNR